MIAITGGGTGGHLVIAKAIKEELNARGIKPIYIGSTAGQDQAWFEHDTGFEQTYFLESKGVVNKKGLQKLFSLLTILRLAFTCKKLFKHHHVDSVFSVGGYSAAPASFGAFLSHLPLYIHEQNAIEGKLNTMLKPFSKAFFSSYHNPNAIQTSYPVSEAFFDTQRIREKLQTVIFLGGSQGATFINQLARTLAPFLHDKGIAIIHQTGKKDLESLQHFYEEAHIPADVFDFSKDIAQKLASADFAISRSGASTLWELTAACLPSLFIPFPHAAANHQYFNAKVLVEQGSALMIEQKDVDPQKVLEQLVQTNLFEISSRLKMTMQRGGAKEIVDIMLQNH